MSLNLIRTVRILGQARNRLAQSGGFTLDLVTGEYAETGFALSVDPEHNEQLQDGYPTVGDLLFYVLDHETILTTEGKRLGAWLDYQTDTVHLDVVTVLGDKIQALTLARQAGELAIYDLGLQEEIRIAY